MNEIAGFHQDQPTSCKRGGVITIAISVTVELLHLGPKSLSVLERWPCYTGHQYEQVTNMAALDRFYFI